MKQGVNGGVGEIGGRWYEVRGGLCRWYNLFETCRNLYRKEMNKDMKEELYDR
jgi:hypothetical protein